MTRLLLPAWGIAATLSAGSELAGAHPAQLRAPSQTETFGNAVPNEASPRCGPRMLTDGDVCLHISLGEDEPLFGHMSTQVPSQSGARSMADAE